MTAPHPYAGDGVADHAGRDRCLVCKLGRDWGAGKVRHELAEVPAETREMQDRILGEGAK